MTEQVYGHIDRRLSVRTALEDICLTGEKRSGAFGIRLVNQMPIKCAMFCDKSVTSDPKNSQEVTLPGQCAVNHSSFCEQGIVECTKVLSNKEI